MTTSTALHRLAPWLCPAPLTRRVLTLGGHTCESSVEASGYRGVPNSRGRVRRLWGDVWLTTVQTTATFSASNRLHRTTAMAQIGEHIKVANGS